MENTVIYYQQKEHETSQESINYIKLLIRQLEKDYIIKGVFIDRYNDRSELYSFINTSPTDIEVIFINTLFDKFDQKLLDAVAREGNLNFNFNFTLNNKD